MGFRIRRSIKIAPGIKLNVGKKGINSVSIGGKGYTKNIGKHGTRTTVGIPGTGISYSKYKKYDTKPKESKIERVANRISEAAKVWRECPIDNKEDKIKLPKIIWKEIIITAILFIAMFIFIPLAVFALISAAVLLFTLLFNKQCWAQTYQYKAIKAYHFRNNEDCIYYCEKSLKKKEYESTRRLLELTQQEIS
ncbi:DUF4236 domain-containing protein [Clostridium sp. AWRP]|uniref:DUF4236 domain-containing protein n=1 Tax=Clostridium sp. AWRP TaxID=2212991 RepID=UPI000FDA2339|nr:DUF4236 domain-containing protein [Clostridium sp. AWRP]AZV56788.1 DUF4236 domain-containing protein [Clostridium sp. AWRP]